MIQNKLVASVFAPLRLLALLRWRHLFFLLVIALSLRLVIPKADFDEHLSREAAIRSGVAFDVARNTSMGRIGLVSSLQWAPLPTILNLFVAPFSSVGWRGYSACIIGAFSLAVLTYATGEWFRNLGFHSLVAYAASCSYFLVPAFCIHARTGTSALLFILLSFLSITRLLSWLRSSRMQDLAICGICLGLAILTRYQSAILLVTAICIVSWRIRASRTIEKYAEATFLVFLVPCLYGVGLWFFGNWLIMNNPLFFLRGLWPDASLGFGHGLLTLLREGCEWEMLLVPAGLILPALLVQLIPDSGKRKALRVASVPAGVVLTIMLGISRPDLGGMPERTKDVAGIVQFLEKSFPGSTFVVSGYRGYEFLAAKRWDRSCNWVHTLQLDWNAVVEDYKGNDIFILVPKPKGADRWEDIQLSYPAIWRHVPGFTLYEYNWDEWLILASIEAHEPLLNQQWTSR
ncbi:MAG TPA: glycosyltransferase family 39 protein [Candidatus Brocadiia bacterium]|nr:glycosyltransferase family 39 protein [Candidatus Brocadiia bacterium]